MSDKSKTTDGPRWSFMYGPAHYMLYHGGIHVLDASDVSEIDRATMLPALHTPQRLLALGQLTGEHMPPPRPLLRRHHRPAPVNR